MAFLPLRPAPSYATLAALESALASFRISRPIDLANKRHASHQAQGRANGAKQGPGKRLGGKKMAGEYVVTGNILFKQRGTHWFPGDNCFMGRDHTIHAGTPGYVTYYRDPDRHPNRKFIGIVFERGQTLPQPPNAVRRRRLGMLAYQMPQTSDEPADTTTSVDAPDVSSKSASSTRDAPHRARSRALKTGGAHEVKPTLGSGYQYRRANWEIGHTALQSQAARSVLPFRPRDRFAAWRKSAARKEKNAERRALTRGGKKKN